MSDTKTILWASIEDYAGLWDAVWELRSSHPELSTDELLTRASTVVADLIARGFVALYRYQEPDGELEAIPESQYSAVLDAPDHWEPPEWGGISIRFGATAVGKQAYREQRW